MKPSWGGMRPGEFSFILYTWVTVNHPSQFKYPPFYKSRWFWGSTGSCILIGELVARTTGGCAETSNGLWIQNILSEAAGEDIIFMHSRGDSNLIPAIEEHKLLICERPYLHPKGV